jgi:hypothetical protein
MSHFTCLALMPQPKRVRHDDGNRYRFGAKKVRHEEYVALKLASLLKPYDENRRVRKYQEPCYCVGYTAKRDAAAGAAAALGTDIHELRTAYWAMPDGQRPTWEDHIAPFVAKEAELLRAHPDHGQADAACDECHGSGKRWTRYNPKSKWDWYVVGGRWNGAFDKYDPAADPRNYQRCTMCGGTGRRDDALAREWRAKDPSYTCNCNWCDGTGKELKWNSDWVPQNNVRLAKLVPADFVPFACVTPDGAWHESAEMGWFAATSNEKEPGAWEAEFRSYMAQYPDHLAVLVDCHI